MNHFLKRVREKARDVSASPVMIVALGDSVTQGAMEHQFLDSEGVYHRVLQQELEAYFPTTTFSTLNAGVSGGSAPQAVERLERDVLRYQPDLVIVAFGLNDSLSGLEGLPKFQAALRTLVSRVQQESLADVVLLNPPFMARQKSFRIHPFHMAMADLVIETQTTGVLKAYADSVREVAQENSMCLVDIYREWERLAEDNLDTDVWLINGLNHPDRRGHKLISAALFRAIISASFD